MTANITTADLRDLVESFRADARIAYVFEKVPAERHAYIRGLDSAAFIVREFIKAVEDKSETEAEKTKTVVYTTADPFEDFD